jgi:excisionase family DNA binding protein
MRDPNQIATGKPVVFLQIPNQRVFKMKSAARYIGVHPQTLRKLTDEGKIRARNMDGRRIYTLEDLDAYIESLPQWYYGAGERSEATNDEEPND